MKVLVTGATGFIGSHVAKKLKEEGNDVHILVREQILDLEYNAIIYKENLNELIKEFKKEKFDLIIHCAALFVAEHKTEDVDNLIKSNVLLTTHLLEAMNVSGTRNIINTSTSWQHYNDEEYNPVCLYAATKQAAEDIIKFYCNAKDINCITLTIFDSFGPHDNRKKLIKLLSQVGENNQELALSAGEQYLDYIYVDDIVEAYMKSKDLLLTNKMSGFNKYYLNSDNPLKLKEIVKIYEETFNVKLNVKFGARPYREREVMNTYKKGIRLPNWEPKYSFKEGLVKMKNEENK